MTTIARPALTTPVTERWRSWQLHTDAAAVPVLDAVLTRVVTPLLTSLPQPGPRWFYLRYWQGGPHIRLRIAGLDDTTADEVRRVLQVLLLALDGSVADELRMSAADYLRQAGVLAEAGENGQPLTADRLRVPGVYDSVYEPEFGRYGGEALMPLTERLFQASSVAALRAVHSRDGADRAMSDGLMAMAAGLSLLPDDHRRVRFLRTVREGWAAWGATAQPGYDAARADELARRHAARLSTTAPLLRRQMTEPSEQWRSWTSGLRSARQHWLSAGHDHATIGTILGSHVHMMENRLGVSAGREGYLAGVLLNLLGET